MDVIVLDETGVLYSCTYSGCANKAVGCAGTAMYCTYHRHRLRKYGDASIHRKAKYRPEFRVVSEQGYVTIHHPGTADLPYTKTILEHRYVMEVYIGRPLYDHENVHHKNGNRQDNRLSNLELWSHSQPRGQRVNEKLTWAREMLELYDGFEQPE
jgi:hypothetical protein